jgi:hypothetical protein
MLFREAMQWPDLYYPLAPDHSHKWWRNRTQRNGTTTVLLSWFCVLAYLWASAFRDPHPLVQAHVGGKLRSPR